MNPKLEHLRVAVVPTETDKGIDQKSTYEEIVACEETQYYSVPDYFQAQNNEDLPLMHWSFLLDYEKKVDCTGMNTDGIDYHSKAQKIGKIKAIITEWGETSVFERERDHSPCKTSIGDDIVELIETFKAYCVSAITYNDGVEIDWNDYSYEELPDEIIDEILEIVEEYEAEMLRTEKRCQS